MTTRPVTAFSFEEYLKEKKLMGTFCPHCQQWFMPPHPVCRTCHTDQVEWRELSGQGTLAAFTVLSMGPAAMTAAGYGKDRPYVAGIVELAEGVRVSARILGGDALRPASIHMGAPVAVTFLEEGGHTLLAFNIL